MSFGLTLTSLTFVIYYAIDSATPYVLIVLWFTEIIPTQLLMLMLSPRRLVIGYCQNQNSPFLTFFFSELSEVSKVKKRNQGNLSPFSMTKNDLKPKNNKLKNKIVFIYRKIESSQKILNNHRLIQCIMSFILDSLF